jgi:hypothetical protein
MENTNYHSEIFLQKKSVYYTSNTVSIGDYFVLSLLDIIILKVILNNPMTNID